MAILRIRVFGDPVLKEQATPVTVFDQRLAAFGSDLLDTLHDAGGVGLAATQVGVLQRVFVFDVGEDESPGHPFGVVVNPVITRAEGEQDGEEGCLSMPGLSYECVRANEVDVEARDVTGADLRLSGEGLTARVFQHEIDHLDGVLFVDRLPRGERRKAMRIWRELELGLEGPRGTPHLHRSDLASPEAAHLAQHLQPGRLRS